MTSTAIITKTYNTDHTNTAVLTFREDGYFNMTFAARAFNKRLDNFLSSAETKEYIAAVSSTLKISTLELVEIIPGNRYVPDRGTWAHPKLAVFFARWLDTKFAVWCDTVIDDILRGKAEVVVTKPEQSEILKMPTSLLETAELWIAELRKNEALKLENAPKETAVAT